MQPEPFLCRKEPLGEHHPRGVANALEGESGDCFPVIGVGFLPTEGVCQQRWRRDLEKLTGKMEGGAFGRLHGDPVVTAFTRVKVDLGRREARWTPPGGDRVWFCQRGKDPLTSSRDGTPQFQLQPVLLTVHRLTVPFGGWPKPNMPARRARRLVSARRCRGHGTLRREAGQ